jgi:hypothetical protein
MNVTSRDGQLFVTCPSSTIAGPFASHEAAWAWVDRFTPEGRADLETYQRIRKIFSGSEK